MTPAEIKEALQKNAADRVGLTKLAWSAAISHVLLAADFVHASGWSSGRGHQLTLLALDMSEEGKGIR